MSKLGFSYTDTPLVSGHVNKKITISDIRDILMRPDWVKYTKALRDRFSKKLSKTRDVKAAISEIKAAKKRLPAFQLSGYQHSGHGITDQFVYNGCVQIDVDLKYIGGDRDAVAIKKKLFKLPFCAMAALSPTFGVKCLFVTDNTNKKRHAAIAKTLKGELLRVLAPKYKNISIDYCEPHKICFVPFDDVALFKTPVKMQTADIRDIIEHEPKNEYINTKAHNDISALKNAIINTHLESIANAPAGEKHQTRINSGLVLGGLGVDIDVVIDAALRNTTDTRQARKDIIWAHAKGLETPIVYE